MQDALTTFHNNKEAFVELGIREHFNIPKVHSMLHYIRSIQLFGSADGFNTESPERLHIDFAKRAYRASNRRDYVIQMTTWLGRQESIYIQETYLAWRGHRTLTDVQDPEEADSDDSDMESELECRTGDNLPVGLLLSTNLAGYYLPSTCPHPNTPISHVVEKHGASELIPTLQQWLQARRPDAIVQRLYPFDRVDVYKYISLLTPPYPHISETKRIHKIRRCRRQPTPAHFDTAVVIENEDLYTGSGIAGLRIGQIKVIFTPPRHFATTMRPLAYVHWFRPLQTFDTNLSMFRLARSSRNHAPNAAIVPVDRILHPCHLIPRFGAGAARTGMTAYNMLDTVDEFYVNRYIDFDFFEQLSQ
ncbi:hypothetical protein BV22DRAFT_1134425 [Leucogyrophana mollusca]|uniref:Uncharacterized protein n=1 Tax=Leucogyrophana mollusca TaxID=85980 RepID=A0ACB8AZU5_9AGAM|nr:hypothetical protein BV22DRAFT_1134425 [Leucogyrophana mollusca]